MVYDYICYSCNEEKFTDVNRFCHDCSQCYCDACIKHHNKILKRLAILGRKDVDKWSTDTTLVYMEQTQNVMDRLRDGRRAFLKLSPAFVVRD